MIKYYRGEENHKVYFAIAGEDVYKWYSFGWGRSSSLNWFAWLSSSIGDLEEIDRLTLAIIGIPELTKETARTELGDTGFWTPKCIDKTVLPR